MTPSASLELLRTRALRFDDGWNAPLEDWTLRVKSHWTFDWPSETDPLLLSIAGHRFDPSSPLLVARDNGRYIVVDGARRLRAVRRIVGLDRRHPYRDWRWGLPPDECEARLRALRMLPCIVTDDLDAARRSALARHVAGNQWSWTVRKVCEGLAAEMERGEREADIESALGIPRAEVRLAALTALVMRRARETLGRQARRLDRGRWDTLRAVLGMQEVRFYLEMRRPMTWPVMCEEVAATPLDRLRNVLQHVADTKSGLAERIEDNLWDYSAVMGDPAAGKSLASLRARFVPRPRRTSNDEAWWDAHFSEDYSHYWNPTPMYGWTWITTSDGAPEVYSLLDDDGELVAKVYQRFGRVICWAPFTWAETAYRSTEDIGDYGFDDDGQRQRHFLEIGRALREWVDRKRVAGVDIALLRDEHAYFYEASNGHNAMTVEETDAPGRRCDEAAAEREALVLDGWRAVRCNWCCEGYRLRDPTGQMRGQVQVRYGVVRAVAATSADADKADPIETDDYAAARRTCRGQIVLQEKVGWMAIEFDDAEREGWIAKAIAAIEATPNPDRAWPASTYGAKHPFG